MSGDRMAGMLARGGGRRGAVALAAAAWVIVLASAPRDLDGQGRDELVPMLPAGAPVVVLPVQSARATPGGAWPGGAPSMEATVEALGAELAFAFADQRGAESWVMPGEVVDRVRRNPVVRVDPSRLPFHGLLQRPKAREQLYEPLHGQLRKVAALFGSRLVVLPLAVWYEAEPPPEGGETGGGTTDASESAETRPTARGRAVLLMAVVDVRRAAVLWHGTMEGDVVEPGSPALLATLAQRVARQLSPS